MFVPLQDSTKQHDSWRGYTVLLPCVAVGNVGQLTVDLVIFNLRAKLCGYIHSPSLLPLTGPNPYDRNSKLLATSCEVYECPQEKLIIVQQRTPVAATKKKNYVEELLNWIQEKQFEKIILLSSCFNQFCSGQDLKKNVFRYLSSPSINDSSLFSRLEEEFSVVPLERRDPYTYKECEDGEIVLPGSGLTKAIYDSCVRREMPLITIVKFCSEGNNYPDAFEFAELLARWLELKSLTTNASGDKQAMSYQWNMPESWRLPFGNFPPESIY